MKNKDWDASGTLGRRSSSTSEGTRILHTRQHGRHVAPTASHARHVTHDTSPTFRTFPGFVDKSPNIRFKSHMDRFKFMLDQFLESVVTFAVTSVGEPAAICRRSDENDVRGMHRHNQAIEERVRLQVDYLLRQSTSTYSSGSISSTYGITSSSFTVRE